MFLPSLLLYVPKIILKTSSSFCRKVVEKTVVRVRIGKNAGKLKNEGPPSDFWSWRKYGQKPIKGSPHPRFISSFILDQVSFLFTIYLNSWFNSFFPLKITVDHTSFLMLLYQLTFWSWKVNSPPWIHWILCKCSKRLPSSVTVISP
jgi:hypothetical protein